MSAFIFGNMLIRERNYSRAGRAHKQKYLRLRLRQRERLSSRRSLAEQSTPVIHNLPRVPETGHAQTSLMFRESHTEVLNRFIAAGQQAERYWTEEELDYLWRGVRRYGLRNWEAMLRDPGLRFSELKTAADLEARWTIEEHKV